MRFRRGESGKDIYGNVVPSSTETNPGYTLYENLRKEDNSLVSTINGILDWAETPEGILLRCRPHRDSVVDIDISPDSMKALLSLSPAVGTGSPLSPESVRAAVEEKEITTGLNDQAVEDAPPGSRRRKPGQRRTYSFRDTPDKPGREPACL